MAGIIVAVEDHEALARGLARLCRFRAENGWRAARSSKSQYTIERNVAAFAGLRPAAVVRARAPDRALGTVAPWARFARNILSRKLALSSGPRSVAGDEPACVLYNELNEDGTVGGHQCLYDLVRWLDERSRAGQVFYRDNPP